MELKQLDRIYLKALFLVEAGIVVTQILSLDTLTSILFLFTFPLTVMIWLRTCRQTMSGTDVVVVITSVLATVGVLLNAAKTSADVSFSSLKKLIMFVMALLFFQVAYRSRISEKMGDFIRRIVDILVVFVILMYFLQREQMYTLNGRQTHYLTYCFSNPNLTAMFLSCLYMLKMHRLFENTKWHVKLAHFIQQVLLGWFVMETQSRNGLLVISAYTVIAIWLFFRSHRNLRMTKGWAVLFSTSPTLVVMGYMLLIQNKWVLRQLSFLVGEGKQLDSRVAIWGAGLRRLEESPLFGSYYEMAGGTGVFQMHNSHLDIAVSYGIIVLILVCVLLARYLYRQGHIYKNKREYIYIFGYACSILLGMGEAAVFSGGLGIYVFSGAFLLLTNQETLNMKTRER